MYHACIHTPDIFDDDVVVAVVVDDDVEVVFNLNWLKVKIKGVFIWGRKDRTIAGVSTVQELKDLVTNI